MKNIKSLILFCTVAMGLVAFKMQGRTIVGLIRVPESFSHLYKLLQDTNLYTILDKALDKKAFTLFAPNDTAFANFGRIGLLTQSRTQSDNKKFQDITANKKLQDFIKFHIVPDMIYAEHLNKRDKVRTLSGRYLETATLLRHILYSIVLDNGIIHVLDTVLVHPDLNRDIYPTGGAPIR